MALLAKLEKPNSFPKGLEISFAALDENRELLDTTSSTLYKFPDLQKIAFYECFITKRAPRYCRIYVRDLGTGAYSFLDRVMELENTCKEPRIIGLSLNEFENASILPLNQLNYINSDKERASETVLVRSKVDPFRMGKNIYVPSVTPYQFKSGVLSYLFHLEHLIVPEDVNFEIQFVIESNNEFNPISSKNMAIWKDHVGSVH